MNHEIPGGHTRRQFLRGATLFAAGALVGWEIKSSTEDGIPTTEQTDVLVDPDKFTLFIDKYLPLTKELADDSNRPLPYEIFLAVSMHESDSGTSELARNANNYFGVIAKDGWTGETYPKSTEEEIPVAQLDALKAEHGDNLEVLQQYQDGMVRVRYPRLFRKYSSPEESFADFINKVYFQNTDDTYRYADVVSYLQSEGRDAFEVASLMTDNDELDEARYATGREWITAVHNYITLIQKIGGDSSGDNDRLPDNIEGINVDDIDFSELSQPRDASLIEKMKEAFETIDLDDYTAFEATGIQKNADRTQAILSGIGAEADYYTKKYNSEVIDPKYIVWHLWQIGVNNSGTPEKGPSGKSHDITLSTMIESWYNAGQGSSCGYLLSDNPDAELWQLTKHPFGKTNHVGTGIHDEGSSTHQDVNNSNALGIEVQADSIYDVSVEQFKAIILWTTKQLFDTGIIYGGLERREVDELINASVIGHGKNNGIEFGYKHTRPMIAALQQYAYIAIKAQ